MFRKRPNTSTTLLAWTVVKTRCPVSADWMAICAVSSSRISPTMILSGSWRRMDLRPRAKVSPFFSFTGLLVQDPDDPVLAVNAGHDGDAAIDGPPTDFQLETAVLWHALFGDVQLGHDLDAGNDGGVELLVDGLHGVDKYAVDPIL